MKVAYRLLLTLGHTLGDMALPLMEHQCQRIGVAMESLTPDDAERLLPAIAQALVGFVVRVKDLDAIMHELKVEIGEERFLRSGAPLPRLEPPWGGEQATHPPGG